MRRDWCVLAGIVLSLGLGTAAARQPTVPAGQQPPQQQQRTRPPAEQAAQGEGAQGKQAPRPAAPEEKSSVTHHSARIGGQTMTTPRRPPRTTLRRTTARESEMFYVAYTKDGVADPAKRPVRFVYNGGPGSASLFTHMGMGPKRVVLTADRQGIPAPYQCG